MGVNIGPDLAFRDGRILADATKRASSDQSVEGLKAKLKADPGSARTLAGSIVKNTYRTLKTRGMKGCYGYCTDAPLAAYLRSSERSVLRVVPAAAPPTTSKPCHLRLRLHLRTSCPCAV